MPIYVNTDERTLARPGDIQPSGSLSFAGAMGSVLTGNFSALAADSAELQQANQGRRWSKAESDQQFSQAGVKHVSPDGGYTQAAIDILIKRKRDEATRAQIDEATPWSVIGSGGRGLAMLMAGAVDPVNLASSMVPGVREARAASMLARAGESALARAATRGVIGAAGGAVGAALLEVPTYAIRTALQDDYSMVDSLLNMAFGTVLGGGLHSVGGAVGDALRAGPDPYARYTGLSAKEVRQVMDFGAGKLGADDFTPAMKRAAGVDRMAWPPETAARAVAEAQPETREAAMRSATGQMAAGRLPDVVAIFDVERSRPPSILAQPLTPTAEQMRELGRVEMVPLKDVVSYQYARRSDAGVADANTGALIDGYGDMPVAVRLNTGEYAIYDGNHRTDSERAAGASEMKMHVIDAKAYDPENAGRKPAPYRGPSEDELLAALTPRTASLTDPIADLRRAAQRQASPDAAYLGSPAAADAATARLAEAPKKAGETEAAAYLAEATQRLQKLRANLEAAGVDPKALDRMTNLAAFDEGIKMSEAIGKALEAAALCGVRQ